MADAAFAPFTIVKSRAEVVDFTTPYYFFRPDISYKNHLTDSALSRKLLFLKPFSTTVWILLGFKKIKYSIYLHWLIFYWFENSGVVTFLTGFILRFFERPKNRFFYSFEHLFVFGTLINQGGSINISKGASRFFMSAWWVFVITVVATYSGNIIANLAVQRVSYPFSSLSELADSPDYKLILLEGASYELMLKVYLEIKHIYISKF